MLRHISFICAVLLIIGVVSGFFAPKKKPVKIKLDNYEEFFPATDEEIPLIIEEDGLVKYYREKRYGKKKEG